MQVKNNLICKDLDLKDHCKDTNKMRKKGKNKSHNWFIFIKNKKISLINQENNMKLITHQKRKNQIKMKNKSHKPSKKENHAKRQFIKALTI